MVQKLRPLVRQTETAVALQRLRPAPDGAAGVVFQVHPHPDATGLPGLEAEHCGGRGHTHLADGSILLPLVEMDQHVAAAVGGRMMPLDGIAEGDGLVPLDAPAQAIAVEANLMH